MKMLTICFHRGGAFGVASATVTSFGSSNQPSMPVRRSLRESSAMPAALATHRFSLEDSPKGYHMFKHKEDGCVRAVFAP